MSYTLAKCSRVYIGGINPVYGAWATIKDAYDQGVRLGNPVGFDVYKVVPDNSGIQQRVSCRTTKD